VPELPLESYSWDNLKIASLDWTRPVVVRGMFKNSTAVETWSPEFLMNLFKDLKVNILPNATVRRSPDLYCVEGDPGKNNRPAVYLPFNESVQRMLTDPTTVEGIILPPASRSQRVRHQGVKDELESNWEGAVMRDLGLDRLNGPFNWYRDQVGKKSTVLTQLFAAVTKPGISQSGTWWHCDVCNNFIVNVAGTKRWKFLDPRESVYIRPVIPHRLSAIAGASDNIDDVLPYIYEKYTVDLNPGDFLYNPELYWHVVENAEGWSLGVVTRECHFWRNLNMNPLMATTILMNHLVEAISSPEARTRLWGFIRGVDRTASS